jgi:hypothetical protein
MGGSMSTIFGFDERNFIVGFILGVICGFAAPYLLIMVNIQYVINSPQYSYNPLGLVYSLLIITAFLSPLGVMHLKGKKKKSKLDNWLGGFFAGIFCDLLLWILATIFLGVYI